jgi:hypothetical protein
MSQFAMGDMIVTALVHAVIYFTVWSIMHGLPIGDDIVIAGAVLVMLCVTVMLPVRSIAYKP